MDRYYNKPYAYRQLFPGRRRVRQLAQKFERIQNPNYKPSPEISSIRSQFRVLRNVPENQFSGIRPNLRGYQRPNVTINPWDSQPSRQAFGEEENLKSLRNRGSPSVRDLVSKWRNERHAKPQAPGGQPRYQRFGGLSAQRNRPTVSHRDYLNRRMQSKQGMKCTKLHEESAQRSYNKLNAHRISFPGRGRVRQLAQEFERIQNPNYEPSPEIYSKSKIRSQLRMPSQNNLRHGSDIAETQTKLLWTKPLPVPLRRSQSSSQKTSWSPTPSVSKRRWGSQPLRSPELFSPSRLSQRPSTLRSPQRVLRNVPENQSSGIRPNLRGYQRPNVTINPWDSQPSRQAFGEEENLKSLRNRGSPSVRDLVSKWRNERHAKPQAPGGQPRSQRFGGLSAQRNKPTVPHRDYLNRRMQSKQDMKCMKFRDRVMSTPVIPEHSGRRRSMSLRDMTTEGNGNSLAHRRSVPSVNERLQHLDSAMSQTQSSIFGQTPHQSNRSSISSKTSSFA